MMRVPVTTLWLLGAVCGRGLGAGEPRVESIPLEEAARWCEAAVRAAPDLARHSLGATLACEPAPEIPGELRYLTDGEPGWGPRLTGRHTFTIALPHGREARIDTVAVYLPDPGDLLEVTVARVPAAGPIAHVAAARLADAPPQLLVIHCESFQAARVQVILAAEDGCMPGEIMLLESGRRDGAPSVLSAGGIDIADPANGGCVFGPAQAAPGTAVLVAFNGNQEALIGALGFKGAGDAFEDLPRVLRASASRDDPFTGFAQVGEFAVRAEPGEQVWKFPRPTRARFLRVECVSSGGGPAAIGSLAVYEGTEAGYTSVLLRGGRDEPAAGRDEREPNDTPRDADPLAPGQWVRGRHATAADIDVFRIAPELPRGASLVEFQAYPFPCGHIDVLNADGAPIARLPWRRAARGGFALTQGMDCLRIEAGPPQLLMVFDAGGLNEPQAAAVARAVTANAAQLPASMAAMCAVAREDSSGGVTLSPEPLTATPPLVLASEGPCAPYRVLAATLERLAGETGNSTVVVLSATRGGETDSDRAWELLRSARAPVHVVDLGDVGAPDAGGGAAGGRGLFNVAWYSGGEYHLVRSNEEAAQVYGRIFESLRTPAVYAVRVTAPAAAPAPAGAPAPAAPVFCSQCGARLTPGGAFCTQCGAKAQP